MASLLTRTGLNIIMDGRFKVTNEQPSSHHMHYKRFAEGYTKVFSHVNLLARVLPIEDPLGLPLAGPQVSVTPLPAIRGIVSLLRHGLELINILWRLPRDEAYILRIPGIFPSIAWMILLLRRIPYGVEVVADPADNFGPRAMTHPLRPFLRFVMIHLTRWQCRLATSTAYVTARLLQQRYPPNSTGPTFSYTDLNLPEESFARSTRKAATFKGKPLTLINVAAMQQTIKGQDLLLDAFAKLVHHHQLNLKLVFIGDGSHRPLFEAQAESLGIRKLVTFKGMLAGGAAVAKALDEADLFVLPSRQEGLPRALLEAMSRALPSVASDVGGVCELLPPDCLVLPDDVQQLIDILYRKLTSPVQLAQESAENLQKAKLYSLASQLPRRLAFYRSLI